jgi:radical SAM protein with 4Fe4S-binding SPASM domain
MSLQREIGINTLIKNSGGSMSLKRKISLLLQNKSFVKLAGTFGLTDRVLNLYWKKIPSQLRSLVAKTGFMPGVPGWAYLEATMRCNLRCKICHQWERREERDDMSTLQMIETINKIKGAQIPLITMTGGEMFMRSDILDVIGHADRVGVPIKINTNGTLIMNRHIEFLRRCKTFECLGTSIDGNRKAHNAARGSDRSFDLTTSMLRNIGKSQFQKMICFTMTEQNKDCIEDIMKLACELKVDRILFLNEHFANEKEIEQSAKSLSLNKDSIFIENKTDTANRVITMMAVQKKIKAMRKKYGILAPIYPAISNNRPLEFYQRTYSCSLFCKAFKALIIANNGDIRVCQYIKEPVGNIFDGRSISEIWNCDKMKSLRMAILKNKTMLPICGSCPCLEEVRN